MADQHHETTRAEPTISQTLAGFAASLAFEDIPDEVVHRAKLHMLDGLGIGLAASTFDFAGPTLAALSSMGGRGEIPVLGMSTRLPLRDATLMNGTLIHGLDFDDTHSGSIVHTSASATATALCSGLASKASGKATLLAYLVAVETAARLGLAVRGDFHQVGLHPTGLLGAFGATLAAGRLAGLTADQLAHAQGIVLSMAGGSMEFLEEGAWTKRMHPGWAGVCGITAATLAGHGFLGPQRAYEGRFGLYRMHLGPNAHIDWKACTADLGRQWEMQRVALKPYPACHFNHAFADATLALVREHGLKPGDVASVRARIAEGEVKTVCEPESNKRRPANSYDAQFSLHYTIALSLVKGRFTLAELDAETIQDPQILDLCDRITYEVDPTSAFPHYYSGEIIVAMKDGRTLSRREQINRGADQRPLSENEVFEKFHQNATRALTEERAGRVLDEVMELNRRPEIGRLGDLLLGG